MNAAEQTRIAWNVFKRLTDSELNDMLATAGIVPMKDRSLRLQQAITVWFHGHVPDMNEVVKLADEPLVSKHTIAAQAAEEWLQDFADDKKPWEETPAADVLTLLWEAKQ